MEKELNENQQKFLLNLAREAIKHYLETGEKVRVKVEDEVLREKRGAFVTLKVEDELRGCIGYPLPYKSLYQTIIDTAISAATSDFRFTPLSLSELEKTKIEVSVLSLPQPISDFKQIEIGKHGIIISKGSFQGLLLPQVPVECNWDLETYLSHGCLKAGLSPDEWKEGVDIKIFTAQVFSE
ncbi:MAG: AmmeMemoRadiSam system protein A [Candidatus Aminicenantia bacterium]